MNTLSKAISILSILMIISTQGIEAIAQTQCFTTNYNKAEQLYRQGRYAEAKRYYKAASACPDKPKQNNISARISVCDNAIREATDQRRRQQEAERNGYIRITNIEFRNIIACDSNTISDYGSTLYASDILYLAPCISYEGLCSTSRSETFDVKIYKPDGSLVTGTSSPSGYTYSSTETIYPGNNQVTFHGWGNNNGGSYTPGTYRFEVWHDGKCLYSTSVSLLPKPEEIQAAENAGYIRVSNIQFGNTDYDGNLLSDYGSTLYASDIRYLKPRIYYDGLCNTQQTVTFFYKIYKPNGELESSASSPAGYTSSFQRTVYPGKNQMMIASGWGNNNGGSYTTGTYRYELWHDGNLVYSTPVTLLSKQGPRYAEIESIWVDHNQMWDGVKGMLIHVKFTVHNMLNRSGQCIAYFYYNDASDTPLQDINNSYCTVGGDVSIGKNFTPNYESSRYDDFTLFMPNSELHVTGKQSLKFYIGIYDNDSKEWLCDNSAWQYFTYGY